MADTKRVIRSTANISDVIKFTTLSQPEYTRRHFAAENLSLKKFGEGYIPQTNQSGERDTLPHLHHLVPINFLVANELWSSGRMKCIMDMFTPIHPVASYKTDYIHRLGLKEESRTRGYFIVSVEFIVRVVNCCPVVMYVVQFLRSIFLISLLCFHVLLQSIL